MMIDTNAMISITEANQNFSKVANGRRIWNGCHAEKQCSSLFSN